jgi:phage-related protein
MSTLKKRVRFHPEAVQGDLAEMPEDVRNHIYQALSDAAFGVKAESAKPFGEDKRLAKVMKIVKDARDGNSYRGAYTIEFPEAIWVLDVFAKKSTQGIKTPKADIDRIVERLKSLRRYRLAPDGKRVVDALLAELVTKTDAAHADARNMDAPGHRKTNST